MPEAFVDDLVPALRRREVYERALGMLSRSLGRVRIRDAPTEAVLAAADEFPFSDEHAWVHRERMRLLEGEGVALARRVRRGRLRPSRLPPLGPHLLALDLGVLSFTEAGNARWDSDDDDGSGSEDEAGPEEREDGAVAALVASCSALRELYVSAVGVAGRSEWVRGLGALRTLHTLDVSSNGLAAADVAALAPLAGLRALTLGYNPMLGADGGRAVAALTALETLSVIACDLTDAGLAQLAPLTRLESLDLNDNGLSDASAPALAGLTRLRMLDVGNNDLRGAGMAAVGALPRLRMLDVTGNGALGDEGLLPLRALPQLVMLQMGETGFSSQGAEGLVAALPALQSVDFGSDPLGELDVAALCALQHDRPKLAMWCDACQAELDAALEDGCAAHFDPRWAVLLCRRRVQLELAAHPQRPDVDGRRLTRRQRTCVQQATLAFFLSDVPEHLLRLTLSFV